MNSSAHLWKLKERLRIRNRKVTMSHAASLSNADLRGLRRLAEQAGCTPQKILKSALRDGFEYTQWFVRQVSERDADLKAGRVMTSEEVLSLIERQRAFRRAEIVVRVSFLRS